MPFILRRVDAVVGIEQFDIEHRWIFSAHRNRPRISLRFFVWILLRIKNDHAFQSAVIIERDETVAPLLAFDWRSQKCRPVIRRCRKSGIPNAHMRRHRFPNAFQRDGVGNLEVSGKKIISTRRINNSSTRPASGRVKAL